MVDKDADKHLRDDVDGVLERLRAETERRGIDTSGKTMAEIKRLLSDLGDAQDKD